MRKAFFLVSLCILASVQLSQAYQPKWKNGHYNRWMGLRIGYSHLMAQPDHFPEYHANFSPNPPLSLIKRKSTQIGFDIFTQNILIPETRFFCSWGIGWSFNHLRIKPDLILSTDSVNGTLVIQETNNPYARNILNTNYIYFPVRIIYYPWHSGKKLNWSISGGMEFQYSVFSWQTLRKVGEVTKLRYNGNNFNMQDKQVAVNFRFAFKRIAFYVDYGLIPLFNPTQQMYNYMPEYNSIHFGVCFNGF